MTIIKIISTTIIAVILFSCQMGYTMKIPPYNTVIRNVGLKDFSHSKLLFNKRILSFGWVTAGNHAVNVNPSAPIPDKATVSWQREDGNVYEKEIEIKNKLNKLVNKQEYYFIVDIDDNNKIDFKIIVCSPDENCLNKW